MSALHQNPHLSTSMLKKYFTSNLKIRKMLTTGFEAVEIGSRSLVVIRLVSHAFHISFRVAHPNNQRVTDVKAIDCHTFASIGNPASDIGRAL